MDLRDYWPDGYDWRWCHERRAAVGMVGLGCQASSRGEFVSARRATALNDAAAVVDYARDDR